jgi:membrane protein YqaA with SNARE-associated domain
MAEYLDLLGMAALLFAVVFVLNVVPAFAPPTWITLSFIGFSIPDVPVVALALIGACAATLGRITLAKLSRFVVRGRLMGERARENIDAIKSGLEHRRAVTFAMFLTYAFSPLPSNYLFIAYGLTNLSLVLVAVPFFLGRLASYSFWVLTATAVGDRLNVDSSESASYVGLYFIISQLLVVPVIYLFTRIDWRAAFEQRRLQWFRGS